MPTLPVSLSVVVASCRVDVVIRTVSTVRQELLSYYCWDEAKVTTKHTQYTLTYTHKTQRHM